MTQLATLFFARYIFSQLVDTPPGTGDIQITLSQTLPFAGAVVVTTPHTLSLVDAAKGVAMFQQMHIPTLALVQFYDVLICYFIL